MEKLAFDKVYAVFDSIFYAFSDRATEETGADPCAQALWILFLSQTGWTEDEFFEELEANAEDHECENCRDDHELKLSPPTAEEDEKLKIN